MFSLEKLRSQPVTRVFSLVVDKWIIWFCYGFILLSLALSEAEIATTGALNADNTWHFKWALDILAGDPIFWSGPDANRIFPDLFFGIIAAALPGGQSYGAWVIYFSFVSALALGLSLILLSLALYLDSSERILFFAVSCSVFVAVTTTLSFWSFNIIAPGYHGGSVSMAIALTALFLMNFKTINRELLFAFALICSLLVMSNFYLVVCLVAPLLVTALLVTQDRRSKAILVSTTLLATLTGLALWFLLNSSYFYRLVGSGEQHNIATVHDLLSLSWWGGRIPKELRELASAWRQGQIIIGLVIMVSVTFWGFRLPFLMSDRNSILDTQQIFRLIVAFSTIFSVMFVCIMVDDVSDWRYRYLIIPYCLAITALSTTAVGTLCLKLRTWLWIVGLSVSSVILVSISLSSSRSRVLSLLADPDGIRTGIWFTNYWMANQDVSVRPFFLAAFALLAMCIYPWAFKIRPWSLAVCLSSWSLLMASIWASLEISSRRYETQFQTDLGQLSRLLSKQDGLKVHNGFANYWIANELSVRAPDIRVLTGLTFANQPGYSLYNNNAWELCSKRDFSFILAQEEFGHIVDSIVNLVGPPSHRQRIQLGRFGAVQVLFYDPRLLDQAIVQPGRATAREVFSNFQCANLSDP